MRRTLFVNFSQVEAPPGLVDSVEHYLDELAEHCQGLLGCSVLIDRELPARGEERFAVRLELGPRRCDPGSGCRSLPQCRDTDLGQALRRAFDAAKRVARSCRQGLPAELSAVRPAGRAALSAGPLPP
jgi:hypothetical protein